MNEDKARALRFEEGLSALEDIVARLEAGDLPLEEALRIFGAGPRAQPKADRGRATHRNGVPWRGW